MKKLLILLIGILFVSNVQAQLRGFSYKALLTDGGVALQNTNVDIRTSIIKDDGVSTLYQETHMTTTDENGIVIAYIGEGNTILGDFSTIDWKYDYYLKVEIDSGSGYVDYGTSLFKTVPYAKYADNGGAKKIDDLDDAIYDNSSIFIGEGSGVTDDGDNDNVGVGRETFHNNTSGEQNVALGTQTLFTNTEGTWNVALGQMSLFSNTLGSGNVGVGPGTLYENTVGQGNIAMGFSTLASNTTGNDNIGIGTLTLMSNTTGSDNVAVGSGALTNNDSGIENTALGSDAGFTSTGNNNVFIGNKAGYHETGDNKLYIENSDTNTPLIGGDFDTDEVVINGKLGVGVSSPDELLHIKGDSNETLKVESTSGNGSSSVMLKTEPAVNNYLLVEKKGSTASGSIAGVGLANLSLLQAGMQSGSMMLDVISDNPMYFATNNTVQMTLEADGDVQVENKITNPYSGDADMKAYIYGESSAAGVIDANRSTDGFSVENTAVGEYTITFTLPAPDHTYNVFANVATDSYPRVISIRKSSNAFFVKIWDLNGVAKSEKFNFVVFKK